MKILDLLGVDLTTPSVIGTFSSASQGKSTLMAYFVKELHDNGKTILIISDDVNSVWFSRLENIDCHGGVGITHLPWFKNGGVLEEIKKAKIAQHNLDCVIVDKPFESNDRGTLTELCHFIRDNKMMLFVAQNTRRLVDEQPPSVELTKIQNIDLGLSLYKKPVTKLPLLKRIVNFITKPFGYTPYKEKNVTLTVVKNRYGRDGHFLDLFLDFKKVNQRQ
jgi:hypothetical protein